MIIIIIIDIKLSPRESPMSITHAQTNRYYLARKRTKSNARYYSRRIQIAMREAYGIYVTDVRGEKIR